MLWFSFTCLYILKTSWSVISVLHSEALHWWWNLRSSLLVGRPWPVKGSSPCTLQADGGGWAGVAHLSPLFVPAAHAPATPNTAFTCPQQPLCVTILSDVCRALGSKYVKASCYSVTIRLHIIIHRWFSF